MSRQRDRSDGGAEGGTGLFWGGVSPLISEHLKIENNTLNLRNPLIIYTHYKI